MDGAEKVGDGQPLNGNAVVLIDQLVNIAPLLRCADGCQLVQGCLKLVTASDKAAGNAAGQVMLLYQQNLFSRLCKAAG